MLLAAQIGCTGVRDIGLADWYRNGFKVGPEYFRPGAEVADEWIDFNNPKVISDSAGVEDRNWWQSLGDPRLDELVQVSYSQNLPLRVAGLRVLEARTERAIVVGNVFPQAQEAFGSYERIQLSRSGNTLGVTPVGARAFDNWQTGFNMSWELDVWGRFRRAIESADANVDVSIEDYDDILVTLVADTAAAYVGIREFEQRIRYAEANIKTQEGSLKLAETRFKNGAVSELDVRQAESNLGQTQALVPALRERRRQANNRLCILLGIPPRDLEAEFGAGSIPAAPPDVLVGIPAELIRRRPDVRRAEREVARQSALIGVAAADLYPAFSINGSLNWQAAKFADLFSGASNGGFVGPAFNWNILNYGRIINNTRVQDVRFRELAVSYQQTVLEANGEVEDAIVGYLQEQQRVRALQFSVDATSRSVELAVTQYREGAVDFDRIFNLQSALVLLQDDLAQSQARVALNYIAIYKSLGGGWQIRLNPQGGGNMPPAPAPLPPAETQFMPAPVDPEFTRHAPRQHAPPQHPVGAPTAAPQFMTFTSHAIAAQKAAYLPAQ
jgi:NodT family efflux transporter outer membrane factor (OMF) lipoprotein